MRKKSPELSTPPTTAEAGDAPVVPVRQLLGKNGRIRLEHDGEIYLLRITRNDKLILTK